MKNYHRNIESPSEKNQQVSHRKNTSYYILKPYIRLNIKLDREHQNIIREKMICMPMRKKPLAFPMKNIYDCWRKPVKKRFSFIFLLKPCDKRSISFSLRFSFSMLKSSKPEISKLKMRMVIDHR